MIQNQHTKQNSLMKLLSQAKLTIIAGAEQHTKPFANHIANRYGYYVDRVNLSNDRIDIYPNIPDGPDVEVQHSPVLFALHCEADVDIDFCAKYVGSHALYNTDTRFVVFFPCARHCGWRSLYSHMDDKVKDKMQLLLLNLRDDTHIDLEVKRGKYAGEYIQFHFDSATCEVTELVL